MNVASLFTLFTRSVYNIAITVTNTDILMNAVIILFINDLEELIYDIFIERNSCLAVEEEVDEEDEATALRGEYEGVKINMEKMKMRMQHVE